MDFSVAKSQVSLWGLTRTAKLTVLHVIKSAGRAGVTHFSTSTFSWTDEVAELWISAQKTQGWLFGLKVPAAAFALSLCVWQYKVELYDGSEPA